MLFINNEIQKIFIENIAESLAHHPLKAEAMLAGLDCGPVAGR
jgi:hypothetical protein